jgi:TolB-like protein
MIYESSRILDRKTVIAISLLLLIAAFPSPCGALTVQKSVSSIIEAVALEYLSGGQAFSRARVGVLPIADASPLAKRHEVGATVKALIELSLGNSLVFTLIDRKTLDASLKELERSLTDPNGASKLRDKTIEDIAYFITGTVTEESDEFRVAVRLVKTDTTQTVASASGSFPIAELVAYGEFLYKQFAFAGAYASAAWDMDAWRDGKWGQRYGDILGFAGVEALIPIRAMYARCGAFAHYAERPRTTADWTWYGTSTPPPDLGINKVQALIGYVGVGILAPVVPKIFGHFGFDFGMGVDARDSLYFDPTSADTARTDFGSMQEAWYFSFSAGMTMKLSDIMALDLQLAFSGMNYGADFRDLIKPTPTTEAHLFLPLRVALVYPF